MKTYMENTFPQSFNTLSILMSPSVTYTTRTSSTTYVAGKSLLIQDVTAEGTVKIGFHWMSEKIPVREKLMLIADHEAELRIYNLLFKQYPNYEVN